MSIGEPQRNLDASRQMAEAFLSERTRGVGPRSFTLSIIIPAYNEQRRLPRTLERIHEYLAARAHSAEVIVVDDGSSDGTARVVECALANFPELRLVSNGSNRGKGFSVRHGMLKARGEITLFTDADLSAPIEEADKLIAAISMQLKSGKKTFGKIRL